MARLLRSGEGVLRRAYKERGIFLVLGAGVSYDSGLPSWPELLERIFRKLNPGASHFGALDEMSPPVLASLLEGDTPDDGDAPSQRQAFAALVRDCLYEGFHSRSLTSINSNTAPGFVRKIDAENSTLRSVSALCVRRTSNGRGFEANPQVNAIVTFNLDYLLQAHSRAKYCELTERSARSDSLILRTLERPSAGSQRRKIGVYHVHGLMRFDKGIDDLQKHAPDLMVLTEQDYFDAFNDHTQMFNYTFLHLLREHTALFIGLSMQDANLRRLLHYSKQERVAAYRAEGDDGSPETLSLKARRHVALLLNHKNPAVNRAYEKTLAPLGVHVIWLECFEQIPEKLGAIYESIPGQTWDDVY